MALGTTACPPAVTDVSDFETDTSARPLIGGDVASTVQFRAAVSLDVPCSAVRVAPKRLLTAGHCVIDPATETNRFPVGSRITVTHGAEARNHRETTVTGVHVHPTWLKACREFYCAGASVTAQLDAADLAVIDLATDLAPLPVALIDTTPLPAGATVVVTGFGCTVGVLTEATAPIDLKAATTRVVPVTRVLHDGSPVRSLDLSRVASSYSITLGPGSSETFAGLCPGDSGGPLYKQAADGSYVVVGINSNYTLAPESEDIVGKPVTNWHVRLDDKSRYGAGSWLRALGIRTFSRKR